VDIATKITKLDSDAAALPVYELRGTFLGLGAGPPRRGIVDLRLAPVGSIGDFC
jgi:hypothetical protein